MVDPPTLEYSTVPKRPSFRRVFLYAGIAMMVVSLLPIWNVWYPHSFPPALEIFWIAILHLPKADHQLCFIVLRGYCLTYLLAATMGATVGTASVALQRTRIRRDEAEKKRSL